MLRCPSTSQTITAFLLLCSCLQLKFPTMTSSSFQTSRLKTVSKRPYVALLPCVGVHAFVCVNFCDTFFLSFFFFTRLGCLCSFSGRARAAAALVIVPVFFFFFTCLSIPSPLLAQMLSGELQQSCRSADGWEGWGGWGGSLCLHIRLSLLSVAHVPLTTTEILLHCDLFAWTSKYCGRSFFFSLVIFLTQVVNWWLFLKIIFWNKIVLLRDLSLKCFLCQPSSVVRFSKSGSLILVNTVFVLFSWRLVGLLLYSMKASRILFTPSSSSSSFLYPASERNSVLFFSKWSFSLFSVWEKCLWPELLLLSQR